MLKSAISLTTIQLRMSFGDTPLSTGTAFFYKFRNRHFLITNRHNLTGRHQDTGAPLSPTAGIPNRVSADFPLLENNGSVVNWTGRTQTQTLELPEDAPPWREHPTLGASADVVALPLDECFPDAPAPTFCVNTISELQPISLRPALPVSVIGYPFGKSVGRVLPVWVNGSIASEPALDVDEKPAFLIDCRTNRGSSGSPVFTVAIGSNVELDGAPVGQSAQIVTTLSDGRKLALFNTTVQRFLGIYSGRINASADLGYLWRERVIEDVCRGPVQTTGLTGPLPFFT